MKVVFLSNYYNHHQAPFSEAMDRLTVGNYTFVETEPMEAERVNMGWGERGIPHFVKRTYAEADSMEIQREIDDADVVIIGSAPQHFIQRRLKEHKLVFRYSERPLKRGLEPIKFVPRWFKWHWQLRNDRNTYLLCSSAYTAGDYAKFGLFKNKTYKWGYFPAVKHYDDIDRLLELKHPASILWVARLIELKHPDDSIRVAERLKKDGYEFSLDIIGNGELEQALRDMAAEKGISDCIHFLGSMRPEEVRRHMEESQVYLFTSDRQEGWGAVLNESMNSGCAVVASHAIGAVPFLIEDGQNGLVYRSGDVDELYRKVKYLLDHPEEQKRLGKAAYETLTGTWSAEVAAERFIQLAKHILDGKDSRDLFESGPCSKADIIKDDWY